MMCLEAYWQMNISESYLLETTIDHQMQMYKTNMVSSVWFFQASILHDYLTMTASAKSLAADNYHELQ